jgi:hypothetical protein
MPELSEKLDYIAIAITFLFIILGLFFFVEEPTITGYTVLESFYLDPLDTSNFVYNPAEIELSNGIIFLKPINTTTGYTEEIKFTAYVESATRTTPGETVDVKDEIASLDGNITNTDKSHLFDVTFNETLNNNDLINLYLKGTNSTQETDIYLCPASSQCSSPGYGLVHYTALEGWFSIIISNLPQPTSSFNIDPPIKVKFDYINATKSSLTEFIETSTIYPSSSSITTNDIIVNNLVSWEELIVMQELNNQNITYEYSIDSGLTWLSIPENNNLSSVDSSSKKMRIKATLFSNTTETPSISLINITYTAQEPSVEATEIPTYYEINNSRLVSAIADQEFIVNSTQLKTELALNLNQNLTDRELNITASSLDLASPASKIKNIEILAPEIRDSITSATLKVYYTDEELASLDESTLRLYYYNETSAEWIALDSVVDIEKNLVLVNITHFSIYGLFGSSSAQSSSSSSSGGGSGGGGRKSSKEDTTTQESKGESVASKTSEAQPAIEQSETPQLQPSEQETNKEEASISQITTRAIIIDRLKEPTNIILVLTMTALVILYITKRKPNQP